MKGREKNIPERRKNIYKCHKIGRRLVLSKKQKEAHGMGTQKRTAKVKVPWCPAGTPRRCPSRGRTDGGNGSRSCEARTGEAW